MLQDETDLLIQVCQGVSSDSEIVHIDNEPSFLNVIGEIEVHECLKGQRRSTKAEEHHHEFKQPKRCDECSFPFITFFDMNVVVPLLYVEFGEVGELA